MNDTTDKSLVEHLAKELDIANTTIDKLNAKIKLLEKKDKTKVKEEPSIPIINIDKTVTINNITYKVLELCNYPDAEFKIRTRNFPGGSSFLVLDQVE